MKKTKKQIRKDQWIADTQMFQRIAKVNVSSYAELEKDWDEMNEKSKKFNVKNIETHRIIQDAAIKAGQSRTS